MMAAQVKEKMITERWISPTTGIVTFEEMINTIAKYTDINQSGLDHLDRFEAVVATDSQRHGKIWKFSTIICVRGIYNDGHGEYGKGGIYYVKNEYYKHMESLRQKLLMEAGITVSIAPTFEQALLDRGAIVDISLHFDINEYGDSKVALKDVRNMAIGTGYKFTIKPDAWGSSGIANKHSK